MDNICMLNRAFQHDVFQHNHGVRVSSSSCQIVASYELLTVSSHKDLSFETSYCFVLKRKCFTRVLFSRKAL